MLLVDINEIESGAVLAAPVVHPLTGEYTLLKAGYELNALLIKRLQELGVQSVWVQHPDLDFLDRHIGAEIPASRTRMLHSIKGSFSKLSQRTSLSIPLGDYIQAINDMTLALLANPDNAVFAERLAKGSEELFSHCANVSYLSMVIALKLRWYIRDERDRLPANHATDVTNLGLGAMMHDLGKLSLPEEMRSWHGIHEETVANEEYRKHTINGFNMVRWRIEPSASQTLLNHHQHYDGLGFPEIAGRGGRRKQAPLSEKQIHIFSRIVAVANTFDAMLATYDTATTAEVLYHLQSTSWSKCFDPVVLGAFLKIIPPFPLGHQVTLSDERRAVVIGLNGEQPFRPIVRCLDDALPVDIDLAYQPKLFISYYRSQCMDQFQYSMPSREEIITAAYKPKLLAASYDSSANKKPDS